MDLGWIPPDTALFLRSSHRSIKQMGLGFHILDFIDMETEVREVQGSS